MRSEALTAFKRCCDAVSPYSCVKQALRLTSEKLTVSSPSGTVAVDVSSRTRFIVTAFGKASIAMAAAAEEQLGGRLHEGIVIAPNVAGGRAVPNLRSRVFYGARNNLPDSDSVAATREALKCVERNDSSDSIFLFLVSGGGSALFCAPDGITLDEKLLTIRKLTTNGADIRVLNAFRQKLSAVKGGKTLNYVKKGQVVALLMSDLIDNLIQFIASGPTILQTGPMMEMSRALTSSPKWTSLLPAKILDKLQDPSPSPSVQPHNIIIGSISTALSALKEYLSSQGYDAHIVTSSLEGNATQRGEDFAELIMSPKNGLPAAIQKFGGSLQQQLRDKVAFLFGGETTVVVRGGGKGGRCQEMTLSCLTALASSTKSLPSFLFLAAGTDGQDGPTDAAGACITNVDVREDIVKQASEYLETSNSYQFWSTYNNGQNHIKPGPTGTNVMDIQIVLLNFAQ